MLDFYIGVMIIIFVLLLAFVPFWLGFDSTSRGFMEKVSIAFACTVLWPVTAVGLFLFGMMNSVKYSVRQVNSRGS